MSLYLFECILLCAVSL